MAVALDPWSVGIYDINVHCMAIAWKNLLSVWCLLQSAVYVLALIVGPKGEGGGNWEAENNNSVYYFTHGHEKSRMDFVLV